MSLFDAMMDRCEELIAEAAAVAAPHSDRTVQEFVSQLRGLDKVAYVQDAVELFPGLQVPDGFYHTRFTGYEVLSRSDNGALNLSEPYELGDSIGDDLVSLTLYEVLLTGLTFSGMSDATSMGPGLWIESFALPIRDPGVLEIAMVLEPFERNDCSEEAVHIASMNYIRSFFRKQS